MGWYQLAENLGMSVARAQAEISSQEYVRWMAFYKLRHEEEERNRKRRI